MLQDRFYSLLSKTETDGGWLYRLKLLPDCSVYAGHFPGHPVSPGVCQLQLVKECVEDIMGKKLLLHQISQCRFLTVVTPHEYAELQLHLQLHTTATGVQIQANLLAGDNTCMELKATLETV